MLADEGHCQRHVIVCAVSPISGGASLVTNHGRVTMSN